MTTTILPSMKTDTAVVELLAALGTDYFMRTVARETEADSGLFEPEVEIRQRGLYGSKCTLLGARTVLTLHNRFHQEHADRPPQEIDYCRIRRENRIPPTALQSLIDRSISIIPDVQEEPGYSREYL